MRKALAGLVLALGCLAGAQADWYVQAVIPETIAVRTPTTTIAFEIDRANYPPPRFPARYPATSPSNGLLPVQVFVNHPGSWNLLLALPALATEGGERTLPPDRILFRVDGGPWLRGSASPVLFYTGSGPTEGWEELRLEFAIELRGDEPAGTYAVNVVITGILGP